VSRSIIYTVSNGKLSAMKPSAPESEDAMQLLVAQHPQIIADEDGELLLIRREQPIGDGEGDSRWSLDYLFVTREGVPVLVELKRAVDTRLRREVVGQMLDYAANATAHWKAGTIAESFEATARSAG
jgi:RecB family endonuclease NucS